MKQLIECVPNISEGVDKEKYVCNEYCKVESIVNDIISGE